MGFGGLGIGETLLILVVALLIFGPKKLPEIGASLGKGIRDFKRSVNDVKYELNAAADPQPPRLGADQLRTPKLEAPTAAVALGDLPAQTIHSEPALQANAAGAAAPAEAETPERSTDPDPQEPAPRA